MTTKADIANARTKTVEEHVRCENAHDLHVIMQTFGADARYDDEPWGEHHEGRGAVQSFYEAQLRAAPDLHIDVKRRHVTDDNIILEVEISGTHQGLFRGLPGTGRRFRFPLCAVYCFDAEDKLLVRRSITIAPQCTANSAFCMSLPACSDGSLRRCFIH